MDPGWTGSIQGKESHPTTTLPYPTLHFGVLKKGAFESLSTTITNILIMLDIRRKISIWFSKPSFSFALSLSLSLSLSFSSLSHTPTHTHTYIYICKEREREREGDKERKMSIFLLNQRSNTLQSIHFARYEIKRVRHIIDILLLSLLIMSLRS